MPDSTITRSRRPVSVHPRLTTLAAWVMVLCASSCSALKAPDEVVDGSTPPESDGAVEADAAEASHSMDASDADAAPEVYDAPSNTFGLIVEFVVPFSIASAREIVFAPDGALWVPIPSTGSLLRMTTSGRTTLLRLPAPFPNGLGVAQPRGLIVGPDGNLWFCESVLEDQSSFGGASRLVRVTPSGAVDSFDLLGGRPRPGVLASGSDGKVWFTDLDHWGILHRMSPEGQLTGMDLGTLGGEPFWAADIVSGPGGDIWFIHSHYNAIARISPIGEITEYLLPNHDTSPAKIAKGPDDDVWISYRTPGLLGRVTSNGVATDVPLPGDNHEVRMMTSGRDGRLWFVDLRRIYSLTTDGSKLTEYPCPESCDPWALADGPDGMTWYVDSGRNVIARIERVSVGP